MRESFLATIGFALLALTMTFAANLAGWIVTQAPIYQWGVGLTVLAVAISYGGQKQFTESGCWLDHHRVTTAPGYSGPANPDAYDLHRRHHVAGVAMMSTAVLACGLAVIMFLIGA